MPGSDWVLLRSYDDGLNAQIALDFLRDHGVPVALRGNSGATAVLNRFDTVLDVRLVVRQQHLADALEALSALESPSSPIEARDELAPLSGHPYRDTSEAGHEAAHRYRRAAVALSFMLPIGSGHFYAGENVAGVVFAISIAACAIFAVALHSDGPALAAMFVVALDALTCSFAVARHNAGTPATRSRQLLRAMACVGVAIACASIVR